VQIPDNAKKRERQAKCLLYFRKREEPRVIANILWPLFGSNAAKGRGGSLGTQEAQRVMVAMSLIRHVIHRVPFS